MNLLLQSRIFANQVGVGPLNLPVGVRQVGVGDSQVLDHLARLCNSSLFLQQRPLQTIDLVRKPVKASSLSLEIFLGFLIGLLRGAPSVLALFWVF